MRRALHRLAPLLLLVLLAGVLPAASLFKAETLSDGTLYSDQVARRIGDLITIRVVENTSVKEETKSDRSRENKVDLGVEMVPGTTRLPSVAGAATAGRLPALKFDSNKEFKGEGSVENSGKVSATVTGRVVDVLDNGNLLVEARRTIRYNQDSKTILLTGICRTADISSGNVILSEKLHNFQVSIVGQGPLSRTEQEGWLSRLLDVIWPL